MHQDDYHDSFQVAVVATNNGLENATTNWSFGTLSEPAYVQVYRTSATEDFVQLAAQLLPSTGLLQYPLPPQTITSFYAELAFAPVQAPPAPTQEELAAEL